MSDITRVTARLRFANFSAELNRRMDQAHKRAGMELRDDVKQLLNRPGYQIRQKGEMITGGFVIRKAMRIDATVRNPLKARKDETNFDVVRSKPGEPPRRQRGTLYQSQTFEVLGSGSSFRTRVGPTVRVAKHARALELGYAPNNLSPRPYLAPAAKRYEPTYLRLVERAVKGATS
jgi:hypothetical protein